ncbi:MAG TPA: sugar ABC transporter substrate-binding protein [Patescibacteria group bacterium]|nr:sugar ABC transporter substrate-binding protein [Patescibacteria group bacterium]
MLDGYQRRTGWRIGAGLLGVVLVVGACGGSPAASPPGATEARTLEIAYLSFAVANSYDAPMLAAAQAAAAAGNARLTVFDANLDPAAQAKQLQDAVASGRFDGVLTQPIFGAGLVAGVEAAIAAGVAVGNIDQILGEDQTTAEAQVEGLMANVAFVPSTLGRKIGELVVKACAELGAKPCNVGYIYSVKVAALDTTLRLAFDEVTAPYPEIQVVAEGESFYTTALGLKAAQDILQAHPDVSVIVGADQAITGAVQAVEAAGAKGKVALVGYGGGAIALQGIASGERFGTVMQMPATTGRLGIEQLIQAIRTGIPAKGMDPLEDLPDGGVVTRANVDVFLPLAEWPG